MPANASRLPTATYRVQLHKDFGFAQAAALADYLVELGVTHLYASPYLQACPGSTHGYDIVDHSRPNPELGGAEGHKLFCETLRQAGLGQVLDIVPNHMSIADPRNTWWWDILENGIASPYASYFDIDWVTPEAHLYNRILLPILADHVGRVLDAGQIRLRRDGGEFRIGYFDHLLPVDFRTLGGILGPAAQRCGNQTLAFIADAMGRIPATHGQGPADAPTCARDRDVLKAQLARLLAEDPDAARALDEVIRQTNASPDALDALLERQHYRLAHWRTAGQELNYRRFFDINTLIGLRVEHEPVFAATHALILCWVRDGYIDGLRIDHPDGLRDPDEYFQRLSQAASGAWIIAEKILAPGEHVRDAWPIDGTAGYDFLNLVGGLFIHPAGETPLTEFYHRFTGETIDFTALTRQKKHLVLARTFGGELNRLTTLLAEICRMHRHCRDYTRIELHDVLAETIACFPVYRTYVRPKMLKPLHIDDVRHIRQAIDDASRHRRDLDERLFHFLADLLLLQVRGDTESELVLRFQQLTGPVTAKAIEDTAFYCYNRLVCLNEVGGDPGRFGVSVDAFHHHCLRIQEDWPATMTTTSTHDTKRSEDVRARISLLSAIPERWAEAVLRWARYNDRHRSAGLPDRNAEYLLYQTLVGAWPIDAERLAAYMRKAAREAKVHTSWTDPNAAYEQALERFVHRILRDPEFLDDVQAFVGPLVPLGHIHSLAQALLKFTAPGIPDIYQGTDLWDLSLVDPDNRRPIDYDRRRSLLLELNALTPEQILARGDDGLPKLWLTRQVLRLRQRHPKVFLAGSYRPLFARGEKADYIVAFSRDDQVVTVVPRLIIALENDWGDTVLDLPEGSWHNELTGERIEASPVPLASLLDRFPVALLNKVRA